MGSIISLIVPMPPGAGLNPALAPHPGEPIVTHARLSAFQGTELELMLRARGIVNVLMTGVAANVTVEGTARDAVNLGYRNVLVARREKPAGPRPARPAYAGDMDMNMEELR